MWPQATLSCKTGNCLRAAQNPVAGHSMFYIAESYGLQMKSKEGYVSSQRARVVPNVAYLKNILSWSCMLLSRILPACRHGKPIENAPGKKRFCSCCIPPEKETVATKARESSLQKPLYTGLNGVTNSALGKLWATDESKEGCVSSQ
ncbi:unnamed protein product [Clavelina lepadiformis]|uniref:Uncharacterized protein n=1 Tax=Clavelina lepadiformis TaxID=159417 RepID=A0ABP0F648_CLALP